MSRVPASASRACTELSAVRAAVATALTVTALTAVALLGLPAATLAATPSAHQIARAVSRAERSSSLWATINLCSNRHGRGGELGIRGQMPTLGFTARLDMIVSLGQWSSKKKAFVAVQGASATSRVGLGIKRDGLQQDGVEFGFSSPAGLLDATVTFRWLISGKVIGETTRQTTAGHRDADYSTPKHFSAASCQIG